MEMRGGDLEAAARGLKISVLQKQLNSAVGSAGVCGPAAEAVRRRGPNQWPGVAPCSCDDAASQREIHTSLLGLCVLFHGAFDSQSAELREMSTGVGRGF